MKSKKKVVKNLKKKKVTKKTKSKVKQKKNPESFKDKVNNFIKNIIKTLKEYKRPIISMLILLSFSIIILLLSSCTASLSNDQAGHCYRIFKDPNSVVPPECFKDRTKRTPWDMP